MSGAAYKAAMAVAADQQLARLCEELLTHKYQISVQALICRIWRVVNVICEM